MNTWAEGLNFLVDGLEAELQSPEDILSSSFWPEPESWIHFVPLGNCESSGILGHLDNTDKKRIIFSVLLEFKVLTWSQDLKFIVSAV